MAIAGQEFAGKVREFLGNDRDFEVYQAYVQKLSEQLATEAAAQ
jgi:hypothetical protein